MTTVAYRYFNRHIIRTVGVTTALIFITAAAIYRFDMTLVTALFIVPSFMWLFYRYPFLLLYSWPVMSTLQVYFLYAPIEAVHSVGVSVLPLDPVYFFTIAHLALCAVTYPRTMGRTLKENRFLTVFLALVALYVVIYTPLYGQSAIGEARKFYFVFLFPLLALVVIRKPEDLKRLLMVIVAAALVITCVTIFFAAQRQTIFRVSDSVETLILAFVAFSFLMLRLNKAVLISANIDTALLCLLSVLVLGSGQRSVWIAVALGAIILLWLYGRRTVFFVRALLLAVMILVAGGAAISAFPSLGSRLGEALSGILDPRRDETASWRLEGWEKQLTKLWQDGNFLLGEGLGGYFRWKYGVTNIKIEVAPHNAYVQTTLKFGLVGLTIYGLLVVEFLRRTLACRKKLKPGSIKAYLEMGIVNFGAAQGYMLGYDFQPIILMFFAVAMCAIKLSQESLRDQPYPAMQSVQRDPRVFPGELARTEA
jgi:O-antigen ligase